MDKTRSLTKSQIIGAVAETAGVTKKQTAITLEALVNLAYKNRQEQFHSSGPGQTGAGQSQGPYGT
jgi:hypothetical protein